MVFSLNRLAECWGKCNSVVVVQWLFLPPGGSRHQHWHEEQADLVVFVLISPKEKALSYTGEESLYSNSLCICWGFGQFSVCRRTTTPPSPLMLLLRNVGSACWVMTSGLWRSQEKSSGEGSCGKSGTPCSRAAEVFKKWASLLAWQQQAESWKRPEQSSQSFGGIFVENSIAHTTLGDISHGRIRRIPQIPVKWSGLVPDCWPGTRHWFQAKTLPPPILNITLHNFRFHLLSTLTPMF